MRFFNKKVDESKSFPYDFSLNTVTSQNGSIHGCNFALQHPTTIKSLFSSALMARITPIAYCLGRSLSIVFSKRFVRVCVCVGVGGGIFHHWEIIYHYFPCSTPQSTFANYMLAHGYIHIGRYNKPKWWLCDDSFDFGILMKILLVFETEDALLLDTIRNFDYN